MEKAWAATYAAIHAPGLTPGGGYLYELSLNDPDDTAGADLRMEIHLPLLT